MSNVSESRDGKVMRRGMGDAARHGRCGEGNSIKGADVDSVVYVDEGVSEGRVCGARRGTARVRDDRT